MMAALLVFTGFGFSGCERCDCDCDCPDQNESQSPTPEEGETPDEGGEEEEPLPEVPVENGRFQIIDKVLYVDGKEFFIQGGCINGFQGMGYYEAAIAAGLNSLRPYDVGAFGGQSNINYLGSNGIYANIGIRISGLTLDNVEAKFTEITNSLKPYLNNPNILLWTIGNELEHVNAYGHGANDYADLQNVWRMVERISVWIHENDPHKRPTTTALIGHYNVAKIMRYAPSLDILSLNYYYPGAGNVQAQMEKIPEWVGSNKPYIISEYNLSLSNDEWKMYTSWRPSGSMSQGGIIEPTTTMKGAEYKKIYNDYIKANKHKGCIGSYIFLWGYQTHGDLVTWHAMFDQWTGYPFSSVDSLAELFGKTPSNRAPVIEGYNSLKLNGKVVTENVIVGAGASCTATVAASDPDGDPLTYAWYIIEDKRLDGDARGLNALLKQTLPGGTSPEVTFNAPSAGKYRLLCYAYDHNNKKAAMASFPFKVN